MTADLFASDFHKRTERLNWYANLFLVGALVMLGLGVLAIVYAPSLTFNDIKNSGQAYDERASKAQLAAKQATDELAALMEPILEQTRQCNVVAQAYFAAWPDLASRLTLPSAGALASSSSRNAAKPDNVGAIDLINPTQEALRQIQTLRRDYPNQDVDDYVQICGVYPSIRLHKSAKDMDAIAKELTSKPIGFDTTALNNNIRKWNELLKTKDFNTRVADSILNEKVQAEARGSANQDAGQDVGARLLQTSITRFGLLAIIGFFVGILVSLYRYNVRLAGFYLARADFFRMFGDRQFSPADASVILQALTPSVEFGKSPASPATQAAELLKTAKEK